MEPSNVTTTLLEVEEAQLDCRKRKRHTRGCLEYELYETENNYKLFKELDSQTYEISPSDAFIVEYPCPREVFAGQYRDRVVHHLIIRRKNSQFEKVFIDASYSCRIGKGTLYGIKDTYEQIKIASDNFRKKVYIVKGDFTSCFMRISKDLMLQILKDFTDNPWEDWLWRKIVLNKPQDYCILKSPADRWNNFPRHKSLFGTDGMPIGNLTSQILVNLYLTIFDWWAIVYKGIIGYGRYVDDFFAIFETAGEAQQFIKDCSCMLSVLNMSLHPNKIKIITSDVGFEFIGAYIKPHRIYVTKRTVSKFSERMHELQDADIGEWYPTLNSYLGYLSQFKSYRIRWKIIRHFKFVHKYGYFNVDLTKFTPFKDYQDLVGCKKSKFTKYEYECLGGYQRWRDQVVHNLSDRKSA